MTADEHERLRALSTQFGTILLRFFERRVKEKAEAEDLVQEVFERLVKRGGIAHLEDARGYLFETAASALVDRARKRVSRHSEQHQSFDPAVHASNDFSSEQILIGRETLSRAARALLELPERTRTVFILRRLEGLRYQDIAKRLGVSLSLVEKQVARAAAYLTQRMGDE
ncbi:RNA polymerase sigma factor [Steroidobacter sp.]|uniref:RNA polymerase sigma factor n=1 Tax=Steroidobacter sp. TaxID=1978227 RepID=UPI001A54C3BD|nr:RNA polymerase sigma factor [Steroidobacter sp.]MBL8270595.1 RNA polymerase sigma factor [Steroidobacter sp.]